MTPLEAAKALHSMVPSSEAVCVFCKTSEWDGGSDFVHPLHCPWLAMPRIIAALEAAERLIADSGHAATCIEADEDAFESLAAALKGDS